MDYKKLSTIDYFLLFAITATLNYFWIQNVQYYSLSGTTVPTFINYYKDSTLYNNSLIVASFEHNFTYYYYIAAVLGKLFSVPTVVSILSLVPGIVVIPLTFALGFIISENKYAAYLSVFAIHSHWLCDIALGGSEGIGDNIAHVSFATVFLLLAWVLYLKKHSAFAYVIMGLMFNIHAPLTLSVFFIILFSEIYNREFSFKKFMVNCVLFIAAAGPTVYWYGRSLVLEQAVPEKIVEWNTLNRIRNVHSFPFLWNLGHYIRFASGAAILLLLPELFDKDSRIYKIIFSTSFAVAILCLIGTLFVEVYNIPLIAQLSLFRSTRFIIYLAAVILTSFLIKKAFGKEFWSAETVAAGIVFAAFTTYNIKVAIIAEIILFFKLGLKEGLNSNVVTAIIILLLGTAGLFLVPKKYIFPLIDNMEAFVVVLLILVTVLFLYKYNALTGKETFYLAVVLVIASFSYLRFFDLYSRDEMTYLNDVKEAQSWFAENGSNDVMILTPPDIESWENYSKRTTFITFGQIATGFYNANLVPEIIRRMSLYDTDFTAYREPNDFCEELTHKFQNMDSDSIIKFASKNGYNIKYLVADNRKSFDFPVVFKNTFFKIYAVK